MDPKTQKVSNTHLLSSITDPNMQGRLLDGRLLPCIWVDDVPRVRLQRPTKCWYLRAKGDRPNGIIRRVGMHASPDITERRL